MNIGTRDDGKQHINKINICASFHLYKSFTCEENISLPLNDIVLFVSFNIINNEKKTPVMFAFDDTGDME